MIEQIKLEDVCDVIAGQSPPSSTYNQEGNGTPFFQGKADFGETYPTVRYWCDSPKKMSEPDDILFSVRAPVGPTNINNINACIGRGLAAIRCREIERNYLLHYLRGNEEKISSLGSGSTFKAITIGTLKDLKIPLPPLDQQKKIAAILDAADAYRQKTKALIEKYDELTQSLFLDMFGDPVINPKGWMENFLGELVEIITYGLTVRPAYTKEGFPVISAKEIKSGEVNFNDAKLIAKDDFDKVANKGKPEINEIIFTKTGAGIGQCAVIKVSENFAITQNIARIKFKKSIDVTYILFYLRTPYIQRLSHRESKGNAIKDLQLGDMKKFKILLPPFELQTQFAERVKAIEEQKAQAQASLAQAEDLFNSLLQRAFKGELTS